MTQPVVVLVAMLTVLLLVAPARADKAADKAQDTRYHAQQLGEHIDNMWSREGEGAWDIGAAAGDDNGKARCKALITDFENDGAKDTDKIPLLDDGPDFVKGEISLADAKLVCDRIQRMVTIKMWEKWAKFSMQEFRKQGGGNIKFYENCLSTYDEMLKQGIAADATVVSKKVNDAAGVAVEWSGTVKQLRMKYCDAGYKKAKEEQEKRDAPYKKVIQGEKLATALLYRSAYLAGGAVTNDPAKLAAASVWFIDTEPPQVCPNGTQRHVIHRFEFAGNKLAKSTDISTCGIPRAGNFK